jgi:hypothetical protein
VRRLSVQTPDDVDVRSSFRFLSGAAHGLGVLSIW